METSENARRKFFKQLILGGVGLYIMPYWQSCTDKETQVASIEGSGMAPYSVWEEILYAIVNSTSHLPGKMKHLIKEGDPEKMLHFVRDDFMLLPESNRKVGDLNISKWGMRYVLRSGFATAREKAELLNHMFQESNMSSKVILERTDFEEEKVRSLFLRPSPRDFSLDVPDEILERWASALGYGSLDDIENNEISGIEDEAQALGEEIWDQLNISPEYRYFNSFNYKWDNYNTPAVQFEHEGATKYAHLFDASIPFGSLKGDVQDIRDAKPLKENKERIAISITYRNSIEPNVEKELISGNWLANEIVGRQLNLEFLTNLTLEEMAVTPVGNVDTFTPAISFQAIDETEEYMADRSLVGHPITLSGQQIQLASDKGNVKIDDVEIVQEDTEELRSSVKDLAVTAKTVGYPKVKLSVTPTDEHGNMVEGLSALGFAIKEDGKPVRAIMQSNKQTPRILLMVDGSGSMPDSHSGENMKKFVSKLRGRIAAQYPAASITYWETNSELYKWLLKASRTTTDLIVFATDGHVWDDYDEKNKSIYENGAPAVILDVNSSKDEKQRMTFKKLADITGGTHVPVENEKKTLEAIVEFLNTLPISPYTFTYSNIGEGEDREVEVTFDKRISRKASYTLPTHESKQLGPSIIGLYLKYEDRDHTVNRVLAGWDPELEKDKEPAKEMVDEVNEFMFGGAQLFFEGAGPTFSNTLADILRVRLSTRELGEALLKKDFQKAKTAFEQGFLKLAPDSTFLMAPLPNTNAEDHITIPNGIRVAIQSGNPGFLSDKTVIKFDYLPTADYFSLSSSPSKSFRETLKGTAILAIREKYAYNTSTVSELEDKITINLEAAKENNWFDQLSRESGEYLYWRKRVGYGSKFKVFDKNASTRAFFSIDDKTGHLHALLPDGTGGGRFESNSDGLGKTMEILTLIINIMDQVAKITKGSGFLNTAGATSLGIVAKYGVTLTKLYAIASEAILIMDTTGMDDKVKKVLQEFACAVQKEILYATNGDAGSTISGLDTLIGMIMGDESPFSCSQ